MARSLRLKRMIAFQRESQQATRMRNRTINLSYRDGTIDGEEIIEGRTGKRFDYENDQYAEITIEQRYAKRIGVKIGDMMVFDVLGIEQMGKIVGIRKVRWQAFNPNFFIVFPLEYLKMHQRHI